MTHVVTADECSELLKPILVSRTFRFHWYGQLRASVCTNRTQLANEYCLDWILNIIFEETTIEVKARHIASCSVFLCDLLWLLFRLPATHQGHQDR